MNWEIKLEFISYRHKGILYQNDFYIKSKTTNNIIIPVKSDFIFLYKDLLGRYVGVSTKYSSNLKHFLYFFNKIGDFILPLMIFLSFMLTLSNNKILILGILVSINFITIKFFIEEFLHIFINGPVIFNKLSIIKKLSKKRKTKNEDVEKWIYKKTLFLETIE